LDLARFAGMIPEEMLGQSQFPTVGKEPYLLTLGPRGFYWLQLR
jgi:maltose alpha-D-glucosyltransferase/alpha-amylase